MNNKTTNINAIAAIICLAIVTALSFYGGTLYSEAKNAELDYQIKLHVSFDANIKDSITLFDGKRKIGTVALTYGEPFAEMILSDNAVNWKHDSLLNNYCRTYYHTCKWSLCPYKGITQNQFSKSVAAYVGNSESDAFSIDMLHLYTPTAEYEELETMLRED